MSLYYISSNVNTQNKVVVETFPPSYPRNKSGATNISPRWGFQKTSYSIPLGLSIHKHSWCGFYIRNNHFRLSTGDFIFYQKLRPPLERIEEMCIFKHTIT
jgi:hypothetical protein